MCLVFWYNLMLIKGFPGGSDGKESTCNAGNPGSIPGSGRSLEKGMATHREYHEQRILAGLQSMGLQRVRQDWVTFTHAYNTY